VISILIQLISIVAQFIVLLVIVKIILSYFMDPYHPVRRSIDNLAVDRQPGRTDAGSNSESGTIDRDVRFQSAGINYFSANTVLRIDPISDRPELRCP